MKRHLSLFAVSLTFACGPLTPQESLGTSTNPVTSETDVVTETDGGCQTPAPVTFACGELTCADTEYCKVISSDIPEFNGSYFKHECAPLPTCTTGDLCDCIQTQERCQYFTLSVGGTCEVLAGGGHSLHCGVGG
jgi:hypothetical protein